VHCFVVIFVVT